MESERPVVLFLCPYSPAGDLRRSFNLPESKVLGLKNEETDTYLLRKVWFEWEKYMKHPAKELKGNYFPGFFSRIFPLTHLS